MVAGEPSRQTPRREAQHLIALARRDPGARAGDSGSACPGCEPRGQPAAHRDRRSESAVVWHWAPVGAGARNRKRAELVRDAPVVSELRADAQCWATQTYDLRAFTAEFSALRKRLPTVALAGPTVCFSVAAEPPEVPRRRAHAPGGDRPPLSAQPLCHQPRVTERPYRREHAQPIRLTRARRRDHAVRRDRTSPRRHVQDPTR